MIVDLPTVTFVSSPVVDMPGSAGRPVAFVVDPE